MDKTSGNKEPDFSSENIFQTLMEESPMPVALYVGSDIVIKMANDAMFRTWGKDASVIGKTIREALPELEGQPFYKLLEDVYHTGITYNSSDDRVDLEVGGRLQTFYYNFSYKPLKNSEGKVWGILNTATNVTEEVLAKKRIEENARNFRNMILQSPVAMCILRGKDFIVEIANDPMFELWGLNRFEAVGKPIFTMLPETKEQGFQQILEEVLRSGETYKANEQPVFLPRKGTIQTVYVNFSYQAIKDEHETESILAVAINVTDQVMSRRKIEESEAELLATKKSLELELEAGKQVQKQKDDFIGIASHELKTPLTSLNSAIQLLTRIIKKDPTSPKVQSLLNQSNTSIKKLINLLEDLLNDTRISEGQLQPNKSWFKMAELINGCCYHVRTAGTHEIISTGDLSAEVYGDENRIEQVLVNFVNNAVKYAPESREIQIHSERVDKGIKVAVIDKGPGIPPEKLKHIFKRYYRVADGQQYSGLGLGLFIASEIIKRHNGEIGVESTLGEGSTFWFTLPDVRTLSDHP